MSRLDSFIRRLEAQHACLGRAADLVADLPGPVLELGLGNGRTYDHLRALMPARQVFAFDRQIVAHPDCIPGPGQLILGEFVDTLASADERLGAPAALAHGDFGSGNAKRDAALAAAIAPLLAPLMAEGAIIVSDQEMFHPDWKPLDLPAGVEPGRYFMWRVDRGTR